MDTRARDDWPRDTMNALRYLDNAGSCFVYAHWDGLLFLQGPRKQWPGTSHAGGIQSTHNHHKLCWNGQCVVAGLQP
eukprot:1158617-Pelagomonas_calceolata.AAC.5